MIKIQDKYDVIVIGSGPAGCTCAVRCAQLGLKALCVDNLPIAGSTKLMPGIFTNAACLETQAFLDSAKLYDAVVNEVNSRGICIDNLTLNMPQMVRHKDSILATYNQEFKKQFVEFHVDFVNAKAKVLSPNSVELTFFSEASGKTLSSKHIVLATESSPISIPCAPIDNEYILDSSAALNLKEVPKRLAILGAGVIGLELGGIWNRLGAEIILLDAQETFLDLADHQISREAYKIFTEQGLELRLGTRITSTKIINKKVHVEYQDSEGTHAIRVDKLFVASGRKPNSDYLAAPEANLLLDENGYVHVNESYRTNLPNVYAIGDLTLLGPMLTHKGIAEGLYVADQIAGIQGEAVDYNTLPNVIYTEPEIAWVGQTEQALKAIGHPILVGESATTIFLQAQTSNKANGIIKLIACANSDAILGIHIISKNAADLIANAVLAMEFSASSEDLTRVIFSHPSIAETISKAALSIKKVVGI
jgi:dihydrolipoamide dehydrogenase